MRRASIMIEAQKDDNQNLEKRSEEVKKIKEAE